MVAESSLSQLRMTLPGRKTIRLLFKRDKSLGLACFSSSPVRKKKKRMLRLKQLILNCYKSIMTPNLSTETETKHETKSLTKKRRAAQYLNKFRRIINRLNQLVQGDKQHHRKVLLSSFHLNCHTLGFHPLTSVYQKSETWNSLVCSKISFQ